MSSAPNHTRDAPVASPDPLWIAYQPAILERLRTIAFAVLSLRLGTLDEIGRASARRAAHKISCSAGVLGYWDVGELAREIEAAFEGTAPISSDMIGRIDQIVIELSNLLTHPPHSR